MRAVYFLLLQGALGNEALLGRIYDHLNGNWAFGDRPMWRRVIQVLYLVIKRRTSA